MYIYGATLDQSILKFACFNYAFGYEVYDFRSEMNKSQVRMALLKVFCVVVIMNLQL